MKHSVAIIDYGAGNVQSVQFALDRIGVTSIVTRDDQIIKAADKVIFPGVGEASFAMAQLKSSGLDAVIPTLTQPLLGICLGMQLLCSRSEENQTSTLGIFPLVVTRFAGPLKVPHMGWNQVKHNHELFHGVTQGAHFYFVHGYYVPVSDFSIANTGYGTDFCAAMVKDNFYAVQFHPEKSGQAGEQILRNFITL